MTTRRVVLIEAQDWVARMVEEGLRDGGYDVVRASQANEGVQKASWARPDCIVCSVSLPDFDGHWVAHQIRAQASAVSTTPFLFLHDGEDEMSPLGIFHVAAAKHVTKPFRVDEVIREI